MVQYISKRDGTLENWDPNKISESVKKAILASNFFNDENQAIKDSKNVTDIILSGLNGDRQINQEKLQDLVEKSLMSSGFFDAAKRYILYREKRREIRDEKNIQLDIVKTIDSYIDGKNWRINENANMDYSYQGLTLNISGEIESKYCLNKYPINVRDAHINNYFHIHDLSQGLVGYCAGWSLYDLLLEGFNLKGCCSSGPGKHFDTILSQIINFIGTLQNEWAGAQAFSSIDTLLAPFVYYDNISYHNVKQSMQRFIYNLNTTSRWGGQCPFSNLTFDLTVPSDYKGKPVIVGGKVMDKTYDEFTKEMNMINKAFLEIMRDGDHNGRIFSFPIPTYNITKEFEWNSEIGKLILEMTAKYGTPYFQNFISSDIDPSQVRSFCCRLQLDKRQIEENLKHKTGGLFGSGELTGSVGVVTLNLPRYAYLSKTEDEFFDYIEKYAKLARNALEFKRKMVSNNLDKGVMPWTKRYLKQKFDTFFSTIGVVGAHEACLNLFNKGIETEEGVIFSKKILEKLRELMIQFQKETGNMYNLEATPAEGTSYKLAKNDKKRFPDIITSGTDDPYYTNSTQLSADHTNDVFFALEHQNKLQPLYTGGTVFHTYIGEQIKDPSVIKDFLLKAFSNTKIPYISITPTFSICETHGYLNGEQFECPECGKETEVYTRVVGYFRPVKRFNKGKKEEYKDRRLFNIN